MNNNVKDTAQVMVDVVVFYCDQLMRDGRFDILDDFVKGVTYECDLMSTSLLLAWATQTYHAKDQLPSRPEMCSKIREELKNRFGNDENRLKRFLNMKSLQG